MSEGAGFEVKLTPRRMAGLAAAVLALMAGSAAVAITGSRADHARHAAHGHDAEGHGAGAHGEHGGQSNDAKERRRVRLSPQAIANADLAIATAAPGRIAVTLTLPGEIGVDADALAHVTPRVAGTVRTVRKQLGDDVAKGEVLATLESRELSDLRREFLAARERLALAKANFGREEQLWSEKISAEKDYLAAKQALAEAEIQHRSAAQKLEAVNGGRAPGSEYALVAPLTGTILEKHISVGEVLKDEDQAFVIADLSKLWVHLTVYAKALPKVRAGQPVTVRAEGIAEPAAGTIAYVGAVVGDQTRSATARVVLERPGPDWRPGLFASAEVLLDEAPARVAIPEEAVLTIEGEPVVFVQEGAGFEARSVRLGRKGRAPGNPNERLVEVLEGLVPGERYVAKNGVVLKSELGKAEAGHGH